MIIYIYFYTNGNEAGFLSCFRVTKKTISEYYVVMNKDGVDLFCMPNISRHVMVPISSHASGLHHAIGAAQKVSYSGG